jgi:hypothetical protein
LSGEYKMKDFGATIMILDMKIHIDWSIGKLYLSQRKYLKKVLKCFDMQD